MIVYRKENGRAVDIRVAPAGYQLIEGELSVEGTVLPSPESLSDAPTVSDAAKREIIAIEEQFSMRNERGLREWFLQSLVEAGLPSTMLNPAVSLNTDAEPFVSLPPMAKRAITAERLVREQRALIEP